MDASMMEEQTEKLEARTKTKDDMVNSRKEEPVNEPAGKGADKKETESKQEATPETMNEIVTDHESHNEFRCN